MQGEQRVVKENCCGTFDNLMIDRMVCQDSQRGKRNVSMAWIDVHKAYDSVDHQRLKDMLSLHRFPRWIGNVVARLSAKWNTRITVRTKKGVEISEIIYFNRGQPQGDALCPRLFTLCLNPVAWKLKATDAWVLSKPIGVKITDPIYIDDMKIYGSTERKLEMVINMVNDAMEDIGLQWNKKKCAVAHAKKGCLVRSEGMKIGPVEAIESLKEGTHYKSLGVLENIRQEDNLKP